MKYKPDESTLISWMYGELQAEEKAQVEEYLNANPGELKRMRELQSVQEIMGKVSDKEVIAPPIVLDEANVIPLWRSTWFRAVVSIAASFLLIIVAGRLSGTEVSYSSGELRISFSGQKNVPLTVPTERSLTEAQVQEMIAASLKQNDEMIDERFSANQKQLDAVVKKSLASQTNRLDELVRQVSLASETQVRAFVSDMRDENLQLMNDYLQLSSAEQKTYVENLLVDFSKWQQEQRNQDLVLFQTRVNNIEQNTNILKQETEQILASIISNSGVNRNQSN